MKNILIIPYSHQLGSTHYLIEIGIYLRDANYNVMFAGEGRYLDLARDEGFSVFKLPEIALDKYRIKTEKGDMRYLSIEEIRNFVDHETTLLQELKIDLVIDTLRPTTYISTRLLEVHRVPLIYGVTTSYYAEPLTIPESHFFSFINFSRISMVVGCWFTKPGKRILFWHYARDYRKTLKQHGIYGQISYEDLTNEGTKILLYDFPEFGPLKKRSPDKYIYMGTPLYDLKMIAPKWLDEVVELKKSSGLPVIYLSMGSTGFLYRKILLSLINYSKRKRSLIIVGNTCAMMDSEKIATTGSEKVFLVDFAPAEKLLPLTDIMVTHG
ncbi:MAG: hypothetical protein KAT07_14365, partial [Calditrichia bacterium]|nr:hypothetical protein [Calditrichia bacterium]